MWVHDFKKIDLCLDVNDCTYMSMWTGDTDFCYCVFPLEKDISRSSVILCIYFRRENGDEAAVADNSLAGKYLHLRFLSEIYILVT